MKQVTAATLVVSIVNQSACSACHARGACAITDRKEKEIEVLNPGRTFFPGQEVLVVLKESQGLKALLFGYLLPFLLVLLTLILIQFISANELLAGVLAFGILIPYYITLSFFRDRLKKVFKFEVEESS